VCVCQTDTASVLSEAIEYIKFLHEQVTVSPIKTPINIYTYIYIYTPNFKSYLFSHFLGFKHSLYENWCSHTPSAGTIRIFIHFLFFKIPPNETESFYVKFLSSFPMLRIEFQYTIYSSNDSYIHH